MGKAIKVTEKRERFDFTVYCEDKELKEKLERYARTNNRSVSGHVLWVVKEWIRIQEMPDSQ